MFLANNVHEAGLITFGKVVSPNLTCVFSVSRERWVGGRDRVGDVSAGWEQKGGVLQIIYIPVLLSTSFTAIGPSTHVNFTIKHLGLTSKTTQIGTNSPQATWSTWCP